ncbi:metal-dependent hydrolase [Halopenitus salinus]|uniref:Metal-dependent hydrolase n=1 Tax=Halopenitus salinus TaxID=1198295 RepID=A0ABD5UWT0_9EURY
MHKKGHYGAALLGYAPLATIALAGGFDVPAVAGALVTLGLATVPDLDMRIPGIPHRGPTHTVQFAVLIGLVTGAGGFLLAAGYGAPLALAGGLFGFATGAVAIGSHIAADALTPMGVEPFGANGPHYSLEVARAANPIANYALLGIGILAAVGGGMLGTGIDAALG